MRNIRWQLLIAIGGIVLIIGLLLGQAPILQTSAPQPVSGGTYTEALIGEIHRLNPILDIFNQVDRDIDRLLYDGLISFDEHGLPQPQLAASWSISADASLYTFTLREDAKWHDGETVEVDDIIYTFSKFQDEDYPGPSDLHEFWNEVNIIRLDDRTIQFQLPEPFAPFLDYLAVGLLPDHLLRGVGAGSLIDHPFNLEPVGTGPMRLDQFLQEEGQISGVSIVPFEDYYGNRPFLERVEFIFQPDSRSALEAYRSGEVQGISQVDPEILSEVLLEPNLNLHSLRLPKIEIVFLNMKHPEKAFLAQKEFRKALQLGTNRNWIIDKALAGQGVVPLGPILPGSWAFSDALESTDYDLEGARNLLDELGWELPEGATPGSAEFLRSKEGQTLSLLLIHPDDPQSTQIAQMLEQSWQLLGIDVGLQSVDPQSLLDKFLAPREYEAILTTLDYSRYPDPDPYPFWHDTQVDTGQNYAGFSDRNISLWLENARITPDYGKRAELYRNFQYRFQDQVPAILLYQPVYNYAIDAQVQGVSLGPIQDPSDRFARLTDWYLIARRSIQTQAERTSNP